MTYSQPDRLSQTIARAFAESEVYRKEAEDFLNMDVSGVVVPASLDRRVYETIRTSGKQPRRRRRLSTAVKLLVAVLAILVAGMITVFSIPRVREAIWETFVEWFDDYIAVSYRGEDAGAMLLSDAADDAFVYRYPRLGEEYRMVERVKMEYWYTVEFYVSENLYCRYTQTLLTQDNQFFDESATHIESMYVDGWEYLFLHYDEKNPNHIIWNDGISNYDIYGYLDDEELLALALTVK